MRWRVIMVCSAAKSFVLSLLESRTCVNSDWGIPLTWEVIGDSRYEPVREQQVLTVVQTKTNVRVRDLCSG